MENGFIQPDNEVTAKVAELYLQPIQQAEVDTLILGCTHYPILYETINRVLGYRVTLVDAGKEVARWAQQFLSAEDLLSDGSGGTISFYVSDSPELFAETAELFLGERVSGKVHQISLELLTDR